MNSASFFTGTIGLIVILFLIVYAVITFLMPFFVHAIMNRIQVTNQLLQAQLAAGQATARAAEQEAKARSFQAELIIAALQRIKTDNDQLLIHAKYQTEVSKHRLAVEEQSVNK